MNGDWHQICLQSIETHNQTTYIYLDGDLVSTAEFGITESERPPNLYLGAYMYYGSDGTGRKVSRIEYHGLLSNLDMWYDSTINVSLYYKWGNDTLPDMAWNSSNIRVGRENNFKQIEEKLIPQYAEHTMKMSEVDTSGCTLSKKTEDIKPVVEKAVYQPMEAKGAKAYGSICMGMLIFIGVIIVLSDVRYFGRVLPIAKRNIKTGMNRLRNMLHKTDMLAGMNQLITLTVSMARDNPTDQQPRNTRRRSSKAPYYKVSTVSMPNSPTAGTSAGRKMKGVKSNRSPANNHLDVCTTSGLSKQDHCSSEPCLQKYSVKN